VQKVAVSVAKNEFRNRLVRTTHLQHAKESSGLVKAGTLASRLGVHEEKKNKRAENQARKETQKLEQRKREGNLIVDGSTTISTFLSTGRSSDVGDGSDAMSCSSYTSSSLSSSTFTSPKSVKSAVSRKGPPKVSSMPGKKFFVGSSREQIERRTLDSASAAKSPGRRKSHHDNHYQRRRERAES
jgi:hypothetical protein